MAWTSITVPQSQQKIFTVETMYMRNNLDFIYDSLCTSYNNSYNTTTKDDHSSHCSAVYNYDSTYDSSDRERFSSDNL